MRELAALHFNDPKNLLFSFAIMILWFCATLELQIAELFWRIDVSGSASAMAFG